MRWTVWLWWPRIKCAINSLIFSSSQLSCKRNNHCCGSMAPVKQSNRQQWASKSPMTCWGWLTWNKININLIYSEPEKTRSKFAKFLQQLSQVAQTNQERQERSMVNWTQIASFFIFLYFEIKTCYFRKYSKIIYSRKKTWTNMARMRRAYCGVVIWINKVLN